MKGYTWPSFVGFWTHGNQYYFAKRRNEKYEVRDCCNYDVAQYCSKNSFYRGEGSSSLWFPLTLVSHHEELKEAEELLIKVCEHIEAWPISHAKYIINEEAGVKRVEGLKEWWTKHKPKTEREKKLEKIKAIINKSGTYCVDDRCEEILKALEE